MLSELLTAISATTNLSGASVTLDSAAFNAKMGSNLMVGTVTFQYTLLPTGWSWRLNSNSITLSEYGLTFNGTPDISTTITVTVADQLDEIKEALKSDNTFKYYHIYTTLNDYLYPSDNLYPSDTLYPGISSSSMLVIENDELIQESCKYTASIADVGNVQIGKCNAARFEFKTFANVTNEAIGQRIRVTMSVGNYQAEIPIGVFNITEVQRTDISEVVKVVAYDDFVKLDQDVARWFNEFFPYNSVATLYNPIESPAEGVRRVLRNGVYRYENNSSTPEASVTYQLNYDTPPKNTNTIRLGFYIGTRPSDGFNYLSGLSVKFRDKSKNEATHSLIGSFLGEGEFVTDIEASSLANINCNEITQATIQLSANPTGQGTTYAEFYFDLTSLALSSDFYTIATHPPVVDSDGIIGFMHALSAKIGVPYTESSYTSLLNVGFLRTSYIQRSIDPQTITGRSFFEQLCQICGVFAIIDRYGELKFIELNTTAEEDLTDDIGIAIIKKARAESFDTVENTGVWIISNNIQAGSGATTVETASLVIQNNFFLDSRVTPISLTDLRLMALNISNNINNSKYTPATVECRGLPYLDLCDKVKVNVKIGNDKQAITTRVINRTMNGIQGLMDTIKGTGTYNTKNIQSNN